MSAAARLDEVQRLDRRHRHHTSEKLDMKTDCRAAVREDQQRDVTSLASLKLVSSMRPTT